MKKILYFVLPVIFILILGGCGDKKEVLVPTDKLNNKKIPADAPKPEYIYESGGLKVNYTASKDLNMYNSSPHTIIAIIYQLTSPDAFMNLSKTKEGVKKLLQSSEFDPSVVSFSSLVIQPGVDKNITTYRAKNAEWIGVVGGYFQLAPNASVSIQKIPVQYDKHWFWPFTSYTSKVIDLVLDINFYEYSLQTQGYYYEYR